MIVNNPIIGVGLGNWKFEIGGYDIGNTRFKFGSIFFQQPHNDFLWIWSEMGVIGFVFYCTIFISALFCIYFSKKMHPLEKTMNGAFFIIFILSSFVDFPKERPIFLLLLALQLAMLSSNYNAFEKKLKWGYSFFLLLLVIAFSMRFLSEIHLTALIFNRKMGNNTKVIASASNLQKLRMKYDHTATPIDFYTAEAFKNQGQKDSAKKYFLLALYLHPFHLFSLSKLAELELENGNEAYAVYLLEQAKRIAPFFTNANILLAKHYIQSNEYKLAENNIHYPMEKEDFEQYDVSLKWIISQLNKKYTTSSNDIILEELNVLKNTKDDRLWLLKSFQNDSLTYQQQLKNHLFYSIVKNKKRLDSVQFHALY